MLFLFEPVFNIKVKAIEVFIDQLYVRLHKCIFKISSLTFFCFFFSHQRYVFHRGSDGPGLAREANGPKGSDSSSSWVRTSIYKET